MADQAPDEATFVKNLQRRNFSTTTSSNETALPLTSIEMIQMVVLIIILAAGFFGNALISGVVLRNRQMRTRTNLFLIQMAVIGMVVSLCCIPLMITVIIKQFWVLGEPLCKFNAFLIPFWLSSSIFTLTVICIHKYLSVVKPLRRIFTNRPFLFIMIMIWISAFACSVGPILGWTTIVYRHSAGMCCPRDPQNVREISHAVFMSCVAYIFPTIAMAILYCKIIAAVKSHCKRIRETAIIDDRGILAQRKSIITIFYVLAAFVICWAPYFIYGILTLVPHRVGFSSYFLRIAYTCGFLYNVCTPIILFARNPRFRRGFKELVTLQRINRPPFLSPESSIPQNCESSRRSSAEYLAEKRCSVWFLSSQSSLLSIEPEPCYRRRKLRWIETYL